MKRQHHFRQADVSRALKAVNGAGLKAARVDIEADGKISVIMSDGTTLLHTANPLDQWGAKRDARAS